MPRASLRAHSVARVPGCRGGGAPRLLLREHPVEECLLVREAVLEGLHEDHPGVRRVLAQPSVVRGVNERGPFGLAERMTRDHLSRGRKHLQSHALRHAHPHALAGVHAPYAVPRPFVRDQAIPADLACQRMDPNVARRRQRREVRHFLRKAVERRLMRREMLPHIEDLGGEAHEVAAERVKIRPAVALDEIILNEVKGPLDFAFRPWPPHPAGAGFDPIVAAHRRRRRRDYRPGLVSGPAEVPEGFLEGLVDRRRCLIATRPVELPAASPSGASPRDQSPPRPTPRCDPGPPRTSRWAAPPHTAVARPRGASARRL